MKQPWHPAHVRVATAASRTARKLRDLANVCMTIEADPRLPNLLLELAGELRKSLKPRRQIRDRRAA